MADKVREGSGDLMWGGENDPSIFHLIFADDLLLFAEANIGQIDCVLRCLNDFCHMSSQKVCLQKSHIIFSRNVPSEMQNLIVERRIRWFQTSLREFSFRSADTAILWKLFDGKRWALERDMKVVGSSKNQGVYVACCSEQAPHQHTNK